MFPPERIVCMTEETTETLYLLGEEHRIVGISGYTVRPPRARKEKPRVSAFISADVPKILALKPDLVFAYSYLQADIVAELTREGVNVHAFHQHSIAEILGMIRMLGALVGVSARADALAGKLQANLEQVRARSQKRMAKPKVYFEEWDDPMIAATLWTSELIGIAGGIDVFAGRAGGKDAKERFVSKEEVIEAAPDIVIASWCGKKFRAEKFAARPGFDAIPAVRNARLHEIKSPIILQPGPAALTDGLAALEAIIGS